MRDKKVGSYISILVINIKNHITGYCGIEIYIANFQKWDYQYIVLMRTIFLTYDSLSQNNLFFSLFH